MPDEIEVESFPGGAVVAAPAQQTASQEDAGKTFTQDELNRIVAERVSRAQAKFADYGELKTKAAELDKVRDANKTDLERHVEAARKEGQSEAAKAYNRQLVQAKAEALAASSKFRDPADAVAFLGDLSKVSVDPDTLQVDTKALPAALADLVKQKPYLLVEDKPTRPTGDAGQGPRTTAGPSNMNALIHGLAQRGT